MSEKLGSSISPDLSKQIQAREAKFGAATRDKATLEYLNSNSAWVKLRSSVNIVSGNVSKKLRAYGGKKDETPGASTIAESLILAGGSLQESGGRSGITFNTKTSGGSGAYHNSSMGFKPMPGITDLTSKSKGTFGTLREAEVSFKVWSKEDLDDIERVYFRVGYSALLEYGHSVYVDNGGNTKTFTDANTVGHSIWFSQNGSPSTIDETINQNRKDTDGNYEGIFGFIKNFSWKLQKDGSYDCSIDIISKGVILEGLKESKPTDHLTPDEQAKRDKEQGEKNKEDNKSNFHTIMNGLEQQKKGFKRIKAFLNKSNLGSMGSLLEDKDVYGMDISVGSGLNWITKYFNDNIFCIYLPLSIVLDALNQFELPKNHKGEIVCGFDTNNNEEFTTFPGHYTNNPLAALPPKPPKGDFSFAQIKREDVHSNYSGVYKSNRILDIMITSHFVKTQLESIQDSTEVSSQSLFDFVKRLLSAINLTFGGINNLDIFYDEINNMYKIVDRTMPSVSTKPERITVNGLSSTVLDINVTSKISPDMASMVSIAAQGNTGNYSENLDNLLKWNSGCVDRMYLSKQVTKKEEAPTKQDEKKKPFKERFEDAWKNFNKSEVIDPEKFNEMRPEATSDIAKKVTIYRADNNKPAGLPVPIELSLTLKGCSLFKIGSVFQLNSTILPDKYKDFGFLICGTNHSIGTDGQWVTEVSCKMYTV